MATENQEALDHNVGLPTGPPPSILPVNQRLNFVPTVLTGPDAELVRRMTTHECHPIVGAINRGIPMATYMLDALLKVDVRHPFIKARLLIERAVTWTVLVNHYTVSRLIFLHAQNQIQASFSGPTRDRLERGLARLERALQQDARAETVLDTIYETDLPDGRTEQLLLHLYTLAEQAGFQRSGTELADPSRCLGLFNYCFRAPRFTTPRAIYTYAEALACLTRLDEVPIPLMTSILRTRDPEEVLNDCMFGVALGNALVRQHRHLVDMETCIRSRLGRLVADCYYIYTQALSTWSQFARLSATAVEMTHAASLQNYDFRRVTRSLFAFVRSVVQADVYACPDFLQEQLLAMGPVHRDPAQEPPVSVELDPLSTPTYTHYREHNPYNDPHITRCPANPAVAFTHMFHLQPRTTSILEEVTPDLTVVFRTAELRDPEAYVHEGIARSLRINEATLAEHTTPTASPTALEPARERASLADQLFFFPNDPQFEAGPPSPPPYASHLWSGADERISVTTRVDRPMRSQQPPLPHPEPEENEDPMLYLAHSVAEVALRRHTRRRRPRDGDEDMDVSDRGQ